MGYNYSGFELLNCPSEYLIVVSQAPEVINQVPSAHVAASVIYSTYLLMMGNEA